MNSATPEVTAELREPSGRLHERMMLFWRRVSTMSHAHIGH